MKKFVFLSVLSLFFVLSTTPQSWAQEEMDDTELLDEAESMPEMQAPDFDPPGSEEPTPAPSRFRPSPRSGGNNNSSAPTRFRPGTPASSTGTSSARSSGNGGSLNPLKATSPINAAGTKNFVDAQPEDISSKTFPEIVESFDYKDAPITDVVNAMAKLTGKRFIYSENLNGKITITSGFKITVAEAWEAFLTALASNGYTIVPSGKFLRIQKIDDAKSGTDVYSGAYYPNGDELITRIIRLKYIEADEASKTFDKILKSKNGQVIPYDKTNSLIITDFGSSVDRISRVLTELDKPGFEEQLRVIPIKNAKAKDIADLIDKIINKDQDKKKNTFRPASRFGQKEKDESLSLVTPDERTNSIIVVGNSEGITRIEKLVSQLDYPLDPSDAGGIYVYYVKHGDAKKIADTLNGIAQEQEKQVQQSAPASNSSDGNAATFKPPTQHQKLFGGDVIIKADENTNSLIITASKQDYATVTNILSKIDIPKDQVYVQAYIVEMNATKTDDWNFNILKFRPGADATNTANATANSVARAGYIFGDAGSLTNLATQGGIFGFGSGDKVSVSLGANGTPITIPSLIGFIQFLKKQIAASILSTPQITAMDNEEAEIEVGDQIPVGLQQSTANNVTSAIPQFKDATIQLKIKPSISPESDIVTMHIEQKADDVSQKEIKAVSLANVSQGLKKRSIKTNLTLKSGDTAVLGGLIQEKDDLTEQKIPFLGDIPILGWLFKGRKYSREKTNLMVFLTPTILRNSQDHKKLLNKKYTDRIEWIKRNANGRDPFGDALKDVGMVAEASDEFKLEDQSISPVTPDVEPNTIEMDNEEPVLEYEEPTPTE
ncbi:MAG: type II secretion system secretin GspD [Bdellovibrionaceae bacterium]|nr:type II secretion system secretin GspD [Pseudobdellovibrionaceae bacterium]